MYVLTAILDRMGLVGLSRAVKPRVRMVLAGTAGLRIPAGNELGADESG